MIPGGRYAFQVFHPGSPVLRVRYRDGILVGPHGFPEWLPYARAAVQLPPPAPDLGPDELRVVDVLTANLAVAASDGPAGGTPAGWVWAHLAMSRRVALVPAELHGSLRHLGGVSSTRPGRSRRGLPGTSGPPPRLRYGERLSSAAVARLEEGLGYRLPASYRSFLVRTNGGRPDHPAVHPDHGFLLDQPLFGVARPDRLQDLAYAPGWFGDRLTGDWLPVGYVQGGLLAVRVRGGAEGSVWYCDDDDRRDADGYRAEQVCARLLHRCADDFTAFWLALRAPPARLQARAARDAGGDRVGVLDAAGLGASLPAGARTGRAAGAQTGRAAGARTGRPAGARTGRPAGARTGGP